jgi:hypothetical protein
MLLSFGNAQAQLPNGSIAPDFTLVDLNGTTHSLYEDYLDEGYTVFLDFSAVWCPPCWSYHTSGALDELYENHGPLGHPNVNSSTTNDVMVFLIEADGSSEECIGGTGCGTHGDWTAGTTFPIICTDGTPNSNAVSSAYGISYFPTVYQVCPDRTLTECGTSASPYSLVTNCLPPPSQNNDARSFMNSSASSGCSSSNPEITIQNYGLNNLTEVKIEVFVNGISQYTTIYDETYDVSTNMYVPLNLSSLEIENVVLDPVTGLVNGDVITIDVTMPNAVNDTDPTNNQTITYVVDLGFDNAYWDADLSITFSGEINVNSWYLKKVSNNLIIASGWGGVTGVANSLPLEFNECYTLQSINAGGESYTITDGSTPPQIILQGTVSMVEEFDNFTTGNEMWTVGVEDKEMSPILIYPTPTKNQLYIEGEYDYLRVINLLGKEVLHSTYQESINTASLKNGIYLLEITHTKNKYYQKIQVSR